MTAIAAVIHDGRVHLGADTAITTGWDLCSRPDGKVFRLGPYVIGCAGKVRGAQLLQYALDPPLPTGDLPRFMATVFVDALRQVLKDGGHAKRESEQESGDTFALVGVHGRLFRLWSDYSVIEAAQPYSAAGCGEDFALGSLFATAGTALGPKRRITLALRAAERFNAAVRGPFTFASTKRAGS